ncbi:MAG: GntR family transcriptional regulator [Victivallaceae bacterium]
MLVKERKLSATPVYLQIKKQLREYIVSNKLGPDSPIPNVKQVAAMAGVSLRTADMAMMSLIEDGVCYRRPKKGTFVAHNVFSNMGQRRMVGINCHHSLQEMESNLLEMAVYRGIAEKGQDLKVVPFFITGSIDENIDFYRSSREMALTGIVLLSETSRTDTLNHLKAFPDVRFVLINYDIANFATVTNNIIGIFNDDFAGGYQAAEYMINKGHRDFAIFSYEVEDENYHHRIDGFLQALNNNGITILPEFIFNGGSPVAKNTRCLIEIGRELMKQALSSGRKLDALLCVNDYLAFGAKEYCHSTGSDIDVIGYDNLNPELAQRMSFPTISIDFCGMGRKAVEVLSGQSIPANRIIRILPRLIPR